MNATEEHETARENKDTRCCVQTIGVPQSYGSASESGRRDMTNYCGTSRALNNEGISIGSATLMSCATGPSLLVRLVRVAGVAEC